MGVLLSIVLWTLAVVGILLAVVIVLPFHITVGGRVGEGGVDGRLRVRWGWFLLALEIGRQGGRLRLLGLPLPRFSLEHDGTPEAVERMKRRAEKKERKRRKRQARRDERRSEKKSRRGRRMGLFGLWRGGRAALRHLRRALGTLALRGRLTGVVGFGDPADTAQVTTILGVLASRYVALELDIEPDYLDAVVELEGGLRARIWILHLIGVLLLALLDREVWGLLRSAR